MCGKPLSTGDGKVWQQAIAMLMGLKVRNGIGEKDLAGAVETALHHFSAGDGSAPEVNIQPTGRRKARSVGFGRIVVSEKEAPII